jgi:hypothetical protein
MISIRNANENDVAAIESMVADFVKGHPAENHPRSSQVLRALREIIRRLPSPELGLQPAESPAPM